MRRGFSDETVTKLKRAYRYLLQSKLNTSQALAQIEHDPRSGLSGSGLPRALHSDRDARGDSEARAQAGRSVRRRRMKLGLIAGNGRFPFLVLDAARSLGHDVTIVAIKDEAFAELETAAARSPAAAVHWVALGHLGTCIETFRRAGCAQAVMAGQVKHTKIFGGVIPDMTALAVFKRLATRNTDSVIAAVVDVLREHGIELLDSTAFLQPLLARPGVLTRRGATTEEQADLEFGYAMADTIAGLDIGQTICVKDRAVVAVEAMEGTDETIRAGGTAGRPRCQSGEGGETQAGHALRRARRGRADRRRDARRRCDAAVDRRR